MDKTALLKAAFEEQADLQRLYLLFEAGTLADTEFQALQTFYPSQIHSLYLHPQLDVARTKGPWLLAVEKRENLPAVMEKIPDAAGVIFSSLSGKELAEQLSWGCSVVDPAHKTVLLRFYSQNAIRVLASCADKDWHAFLFSEIHQWWVPECTRWESIVIARNNVNEPKDRVIRLDQALWDRIDDKPEITVVLREWKKMDSSQNVPPCAQRDWVANAFRKADAAEITGSQDRKIYALFYLDGGKEMLESEAMRQPLEQVRKGESSLAALLMEREDQ